MYKYVIKRLLITIPVLLGVMFVVFTIINFTPGDPASMILGESAPQEDIDRLNHELGYDQPFFVRFFDYVKGVVLEGDLGTSYRTNQPVLDEILSRFPYTVQLAVLSIVFSSLIGISVGILSAVKQYTLVDTASTVLAMVFSAVPGFWLALMLILIFSLTLGWLPSYDLDTAKSYILPTVTLALSGAASIVRLTRSTMLETIRQDYIRTARAKGASERRIIWKHAMKNAMMPVVTSLGMTFGLQLGGTIIVETVFAVPGLGTHVINAIRNKDIPVVLGSTLFLSTLFCIVMLLVDLLYAFLDPRIKAKYSK